VTGATLSFHGEGAKGCKDILWLFFALLSGGVLAGPAGRFRCVSTVHSGNGAGSGPDDAALELLSRRLTAFLATFNEDGSIHLVPVWYLFEDGRFFIGTSPTTRKARNVRARPGATVTVEARQQGSWVSASGTTELLHGEQRAK
jgi:hypothetical protein